MSIPKELAITEEMAEGSQEVKHEVKIEVTVGTSVVEVGPSRKRAKGVKKTKSEAVNPGVLLEKRPLR